MTMLRLLAVGLAFGVVGCTALVAPDPTRLDPHDDVDVGTGAIDSGVRADSGDEMDAFSIENDAGDRDAFAAPCDPGCPDGEICVAGLCRCPDGECCHGCGDAEVCLAGSCAACGGLNQVCCADDFCSDPNGICLGGRCGLCGGIGEPCCSGDTCRGGVACSMGTCGGACGRAGEECCPGETCAPGTVCTAPFLGTQRCAVCGGDTQPCCEGRVCNSDALDCSAGGNCRPCGGRLEDCCDGGRCRDGRTCSIGRCS